MDSEDESEDINEERELEEEQLNTTRVTYLKQNMFHQNSQHCCSKKASTLGNLNTWISEAPGFRSFKKKEKGKVQQPADSSSDDEGHPGGKAVDAVGPQEDPISFCCHTLCYSTISSNILLIYLYSVWIIMFSICRNTRT